MDQLFPNTIKKSKKWPKLFSVLHTLFEFMLFEEDRVYFWRKDRKALKKSRKTGKNTENVAGNWKTPFWSHVKLEKNQRKAGISVFFLRKGGNRPPIPGPLWTYGQSIWFKSIEHNSGLEFTAFPGKVKVGERLSGGKVPVLTSINAKKMISCSQKCWNWGGKVNFFVTFLAER